jgi:hypothetical protein
LNEAKPIHSLLKVETTKRSLRDIIRFTCKLIPFSANETIVILKTIYRSDSDEGGYGQKTQLKQSRQTVYAGVDYEEDGYPRPTAAGRYCEWQHLTVDKSTDIETFEEYKKTLKLDCEPGAPAVLNWTVSLDTPNLVYYQVD